MSDGLPYISIYYGTFLVPFFDAHYKHDHPEAEFPSKEEVMQRIRDNKASWRKVEQAVLEGIQVAAGLTFFENRIPVYIVPLKDGAFSDPIVMPSTIQGDRFVEVLAHELIHRISTYNKEDVRVGSVIKTMFPTIDDRAVANHIFVHAVLQSVFIDSLKNEDHLQNDKQRCEKWPAYHQAWQIVEEKGYKNLLAEFKKRYSDHKHPISIHSHP